MGKYLARVEKTRAWSAWMAFSCVPLNGFVIGTIFLAFWEADLRLEAIVPHHKDLTYPRCVGGRHPAPDEDGGGAWDYQRLQDHYRFPPLEALSVLAETTQSVFRNGSRAGIDLEEFEEATHRVEAYLRFRDRNFDRRKLNHELSELNGNGGAR
jgi:Plasmid pRiA4b ORF-3-like protein